jgi:hypothetical protein
MAGQVSRENGMKGGRPPGSKTQETFDKEAALKRFQERVHKSIDPAIPAHSLATSSSHVHNMICSGVDHPFCLEACRMVIKRGAMTG